MVFPSFFDDRNAIDEEQFYDLFRSNRSEDDPDDLVDAERERKKIEEID